MAVNLLSISSTDSPCFILKPSNFWMATDCLFSFISSVPSQIRIRLSQICFAVMHVLILKNMLLSNVLRIMSLATLSRLCLFLSSDVHSPLGLRT
ncbi:hypothetical protein Dimus_039642 [Dionaea muscipula]